MKPDGKSPPIKHTGKTGISSTKAVFGDPTSKKPNGKAVLHSDSSAKTCVSSARSVSGDPMSKKTNGKAAVASPRADEVVFFRDVEFGPQEGELTDTETKLAERRISSFEFFMNGTANEDQCGCVWGVASRNHNWPLSY
ncbi:hypothetical protein YC2023_018903 [Brassica napus]